MPPAVDSLIGKFGKQLEGFKVTRQLLHSGSRIPEPSPDELSPEELEMRKGLAWQRGLTEVLLKFSSAVTEALSSLAGAHKELVDAGLAEAGLDAELLKALCLGFREARKIAAKVGAAAQQPLEAHQDRLAAYLEKVQKSNAAAAELKHYEEKVARLKQEYDDAVRKGRSSHCEKFAATAELQALDTNKRKLAAQSRTAQELHETAEQALREAASRRGELCNIAQDVFFGTAEALQKLVAPAQAPSPSTSSAPPTTTEKPSAAAAAPAHDDHPWPAATALVAPAPAPVAPVAAVFPAAPSADPWPPLVAGASDTGSFSTPPWPLVSRGPAASGAVDFPPWPSSPGSAGAGTEGERFAPPARATESAAGDDAGASVRQPPLLQWISSREGHWPSGDDAATGEGVDEEELAALDAGISPQAAEALLNSPNLLHALCRRYFRLYDRDRDGLLDSKEAMALVEDLQESLGVPPAARPSQQQVDALMARHASGNDSSLDKETFVGWFMIALRASVAKSTTKMSGSRS